MLVRWYCSTSVICLPMIWILKDNENSMLYHNVCQVIPGFFKSSYSLSYNSFPLFRIFSRLLLDSISLLPWTPNFAKALNSTSVLLDHLPNINPVATSRVSYFYAFINLNSAPFVLSCKSTSHPPYLAWLWE